MKKIHYILIILIIFSQCKCIRKNYSYCDNIRQNKILSAEVVLKKNDNNSTIIEIIITNKTKDSFYITNFNPYNTINYLELKYKKHIFFKETVDEIPYRNNFYCNLLSADSVNLLAELYLIKKAMEHKIENEKKYKDILNEYIIDFEKHIFFIQPFGKYKITVPLQINVDKISEGTIFFQYPNHNFRNIKQKQYYDEVFVFPEKIGNYKIIKDSIFSNFIVFGKMKGKNKT